MAGTMSFQALIPTFIAEWRLSHSEVGWISGISLRRVRRRRAGPGQPDRPDRRAPDRDRVLPGRRRVLDRLRVVRRGLLERARLPGARRPGARRHLHARAQGADRPHRGAAQDPLPVLLHGELLGRLQRLAVHHGRARRALRLAARLRRGGRRAAARGPGAAALGASGDAGAARRAGGSAARLPSGAAPARVDELHARLRRPLLGAVRVSHLARGVHDLYRRGARERGRREHHHHGGERDPAARPAGERARQRDRDPVRAATAC